MALASGTTVLLQQQSGDCVEESEEEVKPVLLCLLAQEYFSALTAIVELLPFMRRDLVFLS